MARHPGDRINVIEATRFHQHASLKPHVPIREGHEQIADIVHPKVDGYNRFEQLEADPAWASVRDHPEFRALVHEMAGGWIERARHKPNPTQIELRVVAHAHIARGEHARALEILERALEMGGPRDAEIRAEVAALRAAIEAGMPERVRLGPSGGL